jgi:hypothetical protein
MKRLHISSLIVIGIGAVAAFISSGAPAASSPDDVPSAPSKEFACGPKDKPKCPLQAWMTANMGPSDQPDFTTLAANFRIIAKKSPGADFPEWSSIATTAAKAADAKNLADVKSGCKNCHDKYKKKFKEEVRDIAFP